MYASGNWRRTLFILITLLVSLSNVIAVPPPLGIAWIPSAKANNINIYTLHATYSQDTSLFDDRTLIGLARQAWNEMVNSADYQNIPSSQTKPGAMVVLPVGSELYFSGSVSNAGLSFVYNWLNPRKPEYTSQIYQQLNACYAERVTGRGSDTGMQPRHRLNGNCGEPNAIHQYNINSASGDIWDLVGRGARMAAWGRWRLDVQDQRLNACAADANERLSTELGMQSTSKIPKYPSHHSCKY